MVLATRHGLRLRNRRFDRIARQVGFGDVFSIVADPVDPLQAFLPSFVELGEEGGELLIPVPYSQNPAGQ